LGGNDFEGANEPSVDASGVVTITGATLSANFPTTPGALDTTYNGGWEAFVTRLDPSLHSTQQLVYSAFLGTAGDDGADGHSVDASSAVMIVGGTDSAAFPTTPGAWDTTHHGGYDVFVTRLDMLPTGVRMFGASSPGCRGALAISVTAMPRIGNATFQITCNGAPPNAPGLLLLAAGGLATPFRVLGVDVWVDPTSAWFIAPPAASNAVGGAYLALPLPQDPWLVNQQANAQFVWLGPTSPPPCPPLCISASSALEITIQQ
jgi:hypothetical protein